MISKKKILFVGSFAKSGRDGSVGGQMFASKLLVASDLKKKVEWFLLDSTADSNLPQSFCIRLFKASKRFFYFIKHLIFTKISTIIIFTADGFSFYEKGTMAILGVYCGKKVILCPRSGLIPRDVNNSHIFKLFLKFTIKKVDYVICQGNSWKYFFQNIVENNNHKFIVIPNWIQLPIENQPRNVVNSPLRILFLGWIKKDKGVFDLLEVAKKFSTDNISSKIYFAGNGEDIEKVKSFVDENGLENVVLTGWVTGEEKQNLLNTTDIFVLPSYFEGFPNALLEAMSFGIPSVATKVGSIPDIIIPNENGLLVYPGDVESLTLELKKLIENKELREKLGRNAKDTVKSNYSIENAVDKFSSIIFN